MKVLLLSVPRSYSKNLEDLISSTLGGDQMKVSTYDNESKKKHLEELLCFNESNVASIIDNEIVFSGESSEYGNHRVPFLGEDGDFKWIDSNKIDLITAGMINRVLDNLEETDKPWVTKFFPHVLSREYNKQHPRFKLSPEEVSQITSRLMTIPDVIIPFMRLDNKARLISSVTSHKFGWIHGFKNPNAVKIKPNSDEIEFWNMVETEFRDFCSKNNLIPEWSEDIAKRPHEILLKYGINVEQTFPTRLEYSSL